GFFVGQRHALACAHRGQCRIQAGRADHRVDHDVDVAPLRGRHQAVGAARPLALGIHAIADQPDERRPEQRDLLPQQRGIPEGRQRAHAKPLGMTLQHTQRRRPDGTGRPQNGDAERIGCGSHWMAGSSTCGNVNTRYATGSAKSRPSIRSNTPPWPGIRCELSFIPASRLMSDSARSPSWTATLITMPNRIAMDGRMASRAPLGSAHFAYAQLATAHTTKAPSAPSTVLPGLTDAINLCRPIDRPTTNPAVSEIQVSTSG